MLELRGVNLTVGSGASAKQLLDGVSARYPGGHFGAVIGPSGCGKSTLLKVIGGIAQGEVTGTLFWKGRDLDEEDFDPSEIGYVPQFSIAHDELTVSECVDYSARLRVAGQTPEARADLVASVLEEVGMAEFSDRMVRVLSGGQKRRLALSMELVSRPSILLCDEVTSGLDPESEDEIVRLLHRLSLSGNRIVLSVTHSLQNIELYDSITVMNRGVLAYQGTPAFLQGYFQTDRVQLLYPQLEKYAPEQWAALWEEHRESCAVFPERAATDNGERLEETGTPASPQEAGLPELPGAVSQFLTIFERRLKIFSRSPAQFGLQAGLIFGFPVLVALFGWDGLPAIKNLSMGLGLDVVQQLVEAKDFIVQASKIGGLVSGIVMFQVILLTLMGANNSGREIASCRLIFEKEKMGGLRPGSYLAGVAFFLSLLVLMQSVWMGVFVHFACNFPGDFSVQLGFLILVNAAMTFVCLGVSSYFASAEPASLVSIYLVGFQLPLSGAVLALPSWAGPLARPFIAAYWSWSGILQTLKGDRYYDIVQMVIQTSLSPVALCLWILLSHIAVGLFAAWIGCRRQMPI